VRRRRVAGAQYSYLATLSHLRRVSTSIDKNSKLIQPRKLHGPQFGVFCPAETPEGPLLSRDESRPRRLVTVASDPTVALRVIGSLIEFNPSHASSPEAVVKLNYMVVG
jgi:hypothetical protein